MFSIEYLADNHFCAPLLSCELYHQWQDILKYEGMSEVSLHEELMQRAQKESLPLALVVFVNGKLAGSASLIPDDMDHGGMVPGGASFLTPWLADVLVFPEYRHLGIGNALVRRVELEACRLGYKSIYLYTVELVDMYLAMGWVIREKTIYAGRDVSVMEKDLLRDRSAVGREAGKPE